jgi:eukaryotic-like serine/threonine-protein kinase
VTRCPVCSGENADTQRFCGECGTPLPASSRPSGAVPVPEADETILLPTAELPLGSIFAHRYQVVEELGVGGMGRVYRVLDKKVGEEVALKLIRPDVASDRKILERFAAELKLARQVVHRNVARMFDLNEEGHVPYITMEYVRGENLKRLIRKVGRLAPAQALPIAAQICGGLDEAHGLGIIHRDLKPQNVMIDEDGQAKILDFGLARSFAETGPESRSSRSGTPAYVAPEQIKGLPVDRRSDLYSLGIVLYEMLTGRTPFQAESVEELIDKHVHETPQDPRELNPGLSAGLSAFIMRLLEKDPAKRFQTAAEAGKALKELSGPVGPSHRAAALRTAKFAVPLAAVAIGAWLLLRPAPLWKNSLAVLPVKATGAEAKHQVLVEGLQSDISGRLSSIPGLRVSPTLTVNSHDLKGRTSRQIGALLGVRYLLELHVAFTGDKIDAQFYLIDARRDRPYPPWKYEKDSPNQRLLQDEIARYTVQTLDIALSEESLMNLSRRGTDNIEAYNLYLEGMSLIEKHEDKESILRAIALQERAIAIDPGYALAYWGAGIANENLYYMSPDEKDQAVLEKMFTYFSLASKLDPTFAETNIGLGWYFFNKGDNLRAYDSFKKALALEPDKYIVNRDAGAFLRSVGLYEQGIRYLKKSAELASQDPQPLAQLAQAWLFLGRIGMALRYAKRAVALDPSDQDSGIMCALLLMLDERLDEAVSEIGALEKIGVPAERLRLLREQVAALKGERVGPAPFAGGQLSHAPHGTYTYLLFGMRDEAIANIQAGIDQGFWNGMYFYSYPSLVKNPRFKDLRGDPRFRAILERQKAVYLRELKPLEKL